VIPGGEIGPDTEGGQHHAKGSHQADNNRPAECLPDLSAFYFLEARLGPSSRKRDQQRDDIDQRDECENGAR
jgi:hypothetical protein